MAGVRVLRAALDARDRRTGTCSEAAVSLAVTTAGLLNLGPEEISAVEQVALLHDIGKICVSDHILHKHGPLEAGEWQAMHRHPVIGAQIVASVAPLALLAPAIRAEHEHWDGTGYPDGLRGDQIPLTSRIVHACNALNAMSSGRPYRKPIPVPAALRALRSKAGSQFDPAVVAALLGAVGPSNAEAAASLDDQPAVLVVEDDAALRLALENGLASEGFCVRAVETADQAYVVAGEQCFEVILLDWLFRVGDSGATACRRLRYLHPSGEIIVLSGIDDIRDMRAARECGATVVLQKGISLVALAERLRNTVQVNRQAAELIG